ncbi:MAG: type VI secretion system baseplate subunit TssK [Acidobacteria bacterium]|nr:type VI secretion system baseplate subunit TssK [Acidobacteriota bacterium]
MKPAASEALLPFEEFVDHLRRQGFRTGVQHHLRLRAVLNQLGPECAPHELKTLLCPLFATNPDQQAAFYRTFDDFYPLLRARLEVQPTGVPERHQPAPHLPSVTTRRWPYQLAAIAVLISAVAYLIHIYLPPAPLPRPVEAPSPQVDTPKQPVPLPAAPVDPSPKAEPSTQPAPVQLPPQPSNQQTPGRLQNYGPVLAWTAILGPIVFWITSQWLRLRRRRLLIRRAHGKTPPYSWPVQTDFIAEIFEPEEIATVSRLLHRRTLGTAQRLDIQATVAASAATLGFPTFRYRRDSRLPEYLILIDRANYNDHQALLHQHLVEKLRDQGLYISSYYYEGDPRVFWNAAGDESFPIEQVQRSHRDDRLLVFGDGDHFLDAITGRPAPWVGLFSVWVERALLTPKQPSSWGMQEVTLANEFALVPATLDGLITLAAYFDLPAATKLRVEASERPLHFSLDPSVLRRYLGDDCFRWLCACAIYPQLQWDLTLSIGSLPCMPPRLVCEENVVKLIRLDWFRAGVIPDEARRLLIGMLDPEVERAVRDSIVALLEKNPAPPGTFASSAQQFQIAYQRHCAHPEDSESRRALQSALENVTPEGADQDYTYLDATESVTRSPLEFVLPKSLNRLLHPPARARSAPTNTIPIAPRPASNFWSGRVTDQQCRGNAQWFLAISSRGGEQEVIHRTPVRAKVGPSKFIERMVQYAIPGLALTHVRVPPPAISARAGTQYFAVNRRGAIWESIVSTLEVGVYVPGDLPDPHIELLIVSGDSVTPVELAPVPRSLRTRRRRLQATLALLALAWSIALAVSFFQNRALKADIDAAVRAVQTVRPVSGTSPTMDDLKRLDELRAHLETLSRWNNEGPPWRYRFGLYSGNDRLPIVRTAYYNAFQRLLFHHVQTRILAHLRSLPAAPGPASDYGYTYDTLRAYLLTTSESHRTEVPPAILAQTLTERWFEGHETSIDAAGQALAFAQFLFYATGLPKENPFPQQADTAAVAASRAYLSSFGAERHYVSLIARANNNVPSVNFNSLYPGSSGNVVNSKSVPGAFSKDGWTSVQTALRNGEFIGGDWVVPSRPVAVDAPRLGMELRARYRAEYIRQWRLYFAQTTPVPFASRAHAAAKLRQHGDVLFNLISLASLHTSVDPAGTAGEDDAGQVRTAFQCPQSITPPPRNGRPLATASSAGFLDSLSALEIPMQQVSQQAQPDEATIMQLRDWIAEARIRLRQMTQTCQPDPEGKLDQIVARLLDAPIAAAERFLSPASTLNAEGASFCAAFRPLSEKFPFNPSATSELTLAELEGLLNPGTGRLARFRARLANESGFTINPTFQQFFDSMNSLAFAFYGASQVAGFRYSVRFSNRTGDPTPRTGRLTIGGQSADLFGEAVNYAWRGDPQSVSLSIPGRPTITGSNSPWAIFRFFFDATSSVPQVGTHLITIPVKAGGRTTGEATFEVNLGGGSPVFNRSFFANLKCVPSVVLR